MIKNKKINSFINYSPFIIFVISIILFHIIIVSKTATSGDFNTFRVMSQTQTYFEFIKHRYLNWSSRVIVESYLYSITQLPIIYFHIIDILFAITISFTIKRLFDKPYNSSTFLSNSIIVSFLLLFNIYSMISAGWIATMSNYMYPLLFLLFSLFPIKNYLLKTKASLYENLLYGLSIIIACNVEQCAAILFISYLIICVHMLIKKDLSKTHLIYLSLTIVSLIFILTCPGNKLRSVIETSCILPIYSNFNLIQKLFVSAETIMYFLFINPYSIYTIHILYIFVILISILTFLSYKNIFIKISSLIPPIILTLLIFRKLFPFINLIITNLFNYDIFINNVTSLNFKSFLSFIVFVIFVLLILYNIILLFIKYKFSSSIHYIFFIFIIGLISIFMMGFSPTHIVSDSRTLIFFQFALIICSILTLNILNFINKNIYTFSTFTLTIISFIYYLMNLFFTFL